MTRDTEEISTLTQCSDSSSIRRIRWLSVILWLSLAQTSELTVRFRHRKLKTQFQASSCNEWKHFSECRRTGMLENSCFIATWACGCQVTGDYGLAPSYHSDHSWEIFISTWTKYSVHLQRVAPLGNVSRIHTKETGWLCNKTLIGLALESMSPKVMLSWLQCLNKRLLINTFYILR